MLPNLVIIGAQKCGTTSLHYYLSQHPEIAMSHTKELNYFSLLEGSNFKTRDWYEKQFKFPKARRAKVRGESSPSYSVYPQFTNVPAKMHELIPSAKLIYLVGDPVRRVVSHYMHSYSQGSESRSFEVAVNQALQNPDDRTLGQYIYRSRYYFQLSQFLSYFQPNQILIVAREDLFVQRRTTLQRIFQFLEVDDNFSSAKFDRVKHLTHKRRRKNKVGRWIEQLPPVRSMRPWPFDFYYRIERHLFYPLSHPVSRPQLSEELCNRLQQAFAVDARQLREYSGQSFPQWSV